MAYAILKLDHKPVQRDLPISDRHGVYGETLKEVIQEKFGDGIMSAIDFAMEVDRIEDPKGDRVLITLNGRFLPYKSW